jgi:hypothetical protein
MGLGCGGHGGPDVNSTPWLQEDFSEYSSTANMLSDPRHIYTVLEDEGTTSMSLDTTTGYGTSTRSMRYDYVNVGCTSQTLTRNMSLPDAVTEVWVEFYVKFTVNFTTLDPDGCVTPPDYKFIFGRLTPDGYGRFAVRWGSQTPPQVTVEAAGNYTDLYTGQQIAVYSDHQWHQVRAHWKVGPSGSASTVVQTWVDGKLIYDKRNFVVTGTPQIWSLALGRNLDQGLPSDTMSVWWGRVMVWRSPQAW